ncbi:MAG: WxcM-like domain-containing protein [Abitibacteriaceae bacterium]|nr:WxcM-like domain-containing protein [Abditibacteriaceae bacterium]
MSRILDCRAIELPKILDSRGNLTFIEGASHVPFKVKRTYWVYDVPGGEARPGHANKTLEEFIVAISGSFSVLVDDGQTKQEFLLNRSYSGLYVPSMIWRRLENFSTNAVCLILASLPYAEEDYIRDYQSFLRR